MTQLFNPNFVNNGTVTPVTPDGAADGVTTIDWRGKYTLNSATSNAALAVLLNGGQQTICYQVAGLTASTTGVLTPEFSVDNGATWYADSVAVGGSKVTTVTADAIVYAGVSGFTQHRLRVSTVGTGTVTIFYSATTGSSPHLTPLSP